MKNLKLKRVLSMLLAITMVLGVCVSALAGDDSIKIEGAKANHTYKAYQIFSGTYNAVTGNLDDIDWGKGVQDLTEVEGFGAATKVSEELAEGTTDVKDFAKQIQSYLAVSSGSATSDNDTIEGLDDGYYLVVDTLTSQTADAAYSAYMVEVINGEVEIVLKDSVPTVEKKVLDINDSETDSEKEEWQDSADYDIGDTVPFELTAELGDNIGQYNAYEIMFVDTLSSGLTFQNGTVEVAIIHIEKGEEIETDITNYCTVKPTKNDDGTTTLKIYCADVIALGAVDYDGIVVNYDALLNESAVVGEPGNPNKVFLTYSNNPNATYSGFSGIADVDENGKPTEKPSSTDENGNPQGSGTTTPDVPNDDGSTGGGEGTTGGSTPSDGTTSTPTDGKTPEDGVVVYTYQIEIDKVVLDSEGNEVAMEGAHFTLYKKSASGKYDVVVEEYTADNLSSFVFVGVDDGDYKLVETKAPTGYNKIDDIYFTIEAYHTDYAVLDDIKLEELTAKEDDEEILTTVKSEDGKITGFLTKNVLNQKGANLPETGGMGTKLFYVFGGLLVLAASVLLITKKRMGNN